MSRMPRPARRTLSLALCSLLLVASMQPALAGDREDERARNAVRVLTDIQAIPGIRHPGQAPRRRRARS